MWDDEKGTLQGSINGDHRHRCRRYTILLIYPHFSSFLLIPLIFLIPSPHFSSTPHFSSFLFSPRYTHLLEVTPGVQDVDIVGAPHNALPEHLSGTVQVPQLGFESG